MKLVKFSILLILLTLSQLGFSKDYVFCNSCVSQADFKSFTKGHHGNQIGIKEYQVVNYATEEVWDVTVTGWYDDVDLNGNPYGGNGIFLSMAQATLPPAIEVNDVKALLKAFKNEGEHLIVLPPNSGSGGSSFSSMTPEFVGGVITVHPLGLLALKKISFFNAIKTAFGFGKILITVVFNNGDTATFEIINPAGGNLCCAYVPGTARDHEGRILNDSNGNVGPYDPSGQVTPLGPNPNTGGWHFALTVKTTVWKCYQMPPPREGVVCFKEN